MIKQALISFVPDLEGCGRETASQHRSAVVLLRLGMTWRGVASNAHPGVLCNFQAVFGNLTGEVARLWSLAIYSFVFRDSAPKARYQDSLGQAKAGFGL